MKKILILFLLLIANLNALETQKLRDYIERWEGYKTKPYVCPTGHLTVGIGHKLLKNEFKKEYTRAEINEFFNKDINIAINAARKEIKNFDSHPEQVQFVIISLIYSVGHSGFNKFVKFKAALEQKDYTTASKELVNSKWYSQVGRLRATNHKNVLDRAARDKN